MIRTKIDNASNASDIWIFEYYCKLEEKLYGQTVTIRSVFKPHERTPSMKIYYIDNKYRFKDFSSDKEGGSILLVSGLFNISIFEAVNKINKDYADYLKNKSTPEVIKECKKVPGYKVTSHIKRNWNELDASFWTQFNIGSRLLKKYNVFPLESYVLSKETDQGVDKIVIEGQRLYGYFTNDGDLYKIYQPFNKRKKFIVVFNHIQGSEQLSYSKPTLIITSSLKDIMSLDSLNFEAEYVSPNSENTMISRSVLSAYFLKYKNIYTLFDNDDAGHKAMVNYESNFGIPGIYLKMSKDPSDSIKDHSPKKVKQYLRPLIP